MIILLLHTLIWHPRDFKKNVLCHCSNFLRKRMQPIPRPHSGSCLWFFITPLTTMSYFSTLFLWMQQSAVSTWYLLIYLQCNFKTKNKIVRFIYFYYIYYIVFPFSCKAYSILYRSSDVSVTMWSQNPQIGYNVWSLLKYIHLWKFKHFS